MNRIAVRLRHFGHPWIFSNEVVNDHNARPGEVVVAEEKGKTVGTGFYNPHSLIAVRLFARTEQDFDAGLIRDRLIAARQRRAVMGRSHRLVYSESDGLPGLIIDRYEDYYVVQINSLGIDNIKTRLYEIMIDELQPRGIYEKNDEGLRRMEGLEPVRATVHGMIPAEIEIEQDDRRFLVDVVNGQKTGFFFDQRSNRRRVGELARGEILDGCCYTGGFAVYAAGKGRVLGIDSSAAAIALAERNARLNNAEAAFMCQDILTALDQLAGEKRFFDTVILDPPSFARSKKKVMSARRGYKKLNRAAMRVLAEGGMLFSASCSYNLSEEIFLEALRDAAAEAGMVFRVADHGNLPPDHPVLLNLPESNYLKSVFLQRE